MSVINITPVYVSVSAANVGALNTAVGAAVTAAQALTNYLPNSVEIDPGIAAAVSGQDGSTTTLFASIRYKTYTEPQI